MKALRETPTKKLKAQSVEDLHILLYYLLDAATRTQHVLQVASFTDASHEYQLDAIGETLNNAGQALRRARASREVIASRADKKAKTKKR